MASGEGPLLPFVSGGVGPHSPLVCGGVGPLLPFMPGAVGPSSPFAHGGLGPSFTMHGAGHLLSFVDGGGVPLSCRFWVVVVVCPCQFLCAMVRGPHHCCGGPVTI